MDWLEAKFKALEIDLEIEAELQDLKKNLHHHGQTSNHQSTSSHTGSYHTASANHEPNRKSSQPNFSEYYSVLGIQFGASLKDIKQAYRDLVFVWHPDRFPNNLRLQKIAEKKIKKINIAYNILVAKN